MISFKTNKFKKGDKVVCVGNTSTDGVEFGKVYTVKNPSSHLGFYNSKLHNYVTLEEDDVVTPNEDCLELYIEPRNYRNMKPTDLIKISIDGNEAEVPLGDLVASEALLGYSSGCYTYMLWKFISNMLGKEVIKLEGRGIDFSNKQKEALDYFFKPYYDKLDKEKVVLMELIENKTKELAELKDKLSNL